MQQMTHLQRLARTLTTIMVLCAMLLASVVSALHQSGHSECDDSPVTVVAQDSCCTPTPPAPAPPKDADHSHDNHSDHHDCAKCPCHAAIALPLPLEGMRLLDAPKDSVILNARLLLLEAPTRAIDQPPKLNS